MQSKYTPKDIQRFWNKADKSGGEDACWTWRGCYSNDGYGKAYLPGCKIRRAHRVAWLLTHGEIAAGLVVCHKCDNPACVNPSHMFLGTHQDNVNDKMAKGRNPSRRGEKNGNRKLSDTQVAEIRERSANGERSRKLANEFGVGYNQIWYIVTYRQRT